MKRNYFYGLIKSFGVIPSVLLALTLILISYISISPEVFADIFVNSDILTNLLTGGLYALFIGFAVIGLSNLRAPQLSFADFIRVSGFLASIGIVAILSTRPVTDLPAIITYAVILDVLLVEVVIRFIFARYENERVGFKAFISSLCNRFNPVILAVIGVALGTVGYFFYNALSGFLGYVEQYAGGIGLAMLIVVLLLSVCRRNPKAGLIDALLAIAFYTEITVLIYWLNKMSVETFNSIAILMAATISSLIYRGTSFVGEEEKPSRIKINRYYSDLHFKFDVSFSVLIAVVIVGCFMIPSFRYEGFNRVLTAMGLNSISFGNSTDIINYCVVGALGALLVLLLIFRRLKSKTIRVIDGIVNILMMTSLFILPYFVIFAVNFTDNLTTIQNSVSLMAVNIAFVVIFVFAVLLQILRYAFYRGETVVVEAVAEPVQEEEAEEVLEEPVQEESEAVEKTAEEVVVVEEIPAEEASEPETEEAVEEEETTLDEEESEAMDETLEEEEPEEEVEEALDEPYEEEPVEEEESIPAKERDILMPEVTIVDENGTPKKIKRRFNTRMMFAPYEAKEYYNEIKNYLIMYRAKGRYSARCETFRYRGLVAKVALAGKSIKVCLAIDPQSLVGTKYRYKDVSAKKQYAEVPTMIKVRSARGLKYFKELVDIMMANRGVKPKRNYQPTNFMPQLIPNGEAILATLGMSTDYLYPSMNARSIPAEMPEDIADYLPVIQGEELQEEEVEASIYLDTLCNHFVDGDEITIDILKSLHIVTKGNVLRIKARGTLDRRLIIYAEYFEPDALKMLMCTNCTAIKIIR